ncbi:hypothetical protein V2J09_015222 [Rumex salicifolius]
MSGIGILLDLLKKNPDFVSKSLHSYGSFSAKVAVSAAAASAAASYPFAFRAFLSNSAIPVAYCDAAPTWSEDQLPSDLTSSELGFQSDSIKYTPKEYYFELKPVYSAFEWKAFTITTLRSFLMYYLPLLEPRAISDEDDDDFLQDSPLAKQSVDLVTPFKKSLKQILRESTVVTTRRVLERLAVTYVSQRRAWKLLKDAPKSAIRKAQRGMPTTSYVYCVGKMTFRAHFLAVAATWIVQVGIDTYRCLSHLFGSKEEELEEVDAKKELQILMKKILSSTLKCSSALVFASLGAGICSIIIRPSAGQWIGCAIGDLTGPIVISVCLDKFLHYQI